MSTRAQFLTPSDATKTLGVSEKALRVYEAILLCPANHSPPNYVAPYPGAQGYEAVATCLTSPEVRARSNGVFAWRPVATAG